MSSSLRRGTLAASALVISIASLSACAAGNDAQTLQVKPDNAATSVGDVKIQNASVITQPEPTAEGPAVVTATLFNNGTEQQTIESITLAGSSAPVKLSPATGSGPLTVPAGGSLVLGGKGNASAVIDKGREAAKNGDSQKVVFRFSQTGEVAINAFVVPAASYFKDYGPSEAPQASATPSAAAPSGTPSGSPSAPAEGVQGGDNASSSPSDAASASENAGH
ncbi:DUF461 domain-containing protein [Streptomyces sp. NPDC059176]|uniref:DUF461 domain-containing protein n=1 Tax=unclassified Streptomyces TaxID=2593676 RepID=UPI0036827440